MTGVSSGHLVRGDEAWGVLFELSPAVLFLTSLADGRYLDVNAAFSRIIGYTKDEIVGKGAAEVEVWFDPSVRARAMALHGEQGTLRDFEVLLRTKHEEIVQATVSLATVCVDGVACLLTQAECISPLQGGEACVQAGESQYRTLVENSSDAILRLDRDGRILYANPAAAQMLSLPPRELLGKRYPDLGMTPELCGFWETRVREVFDSGQGQQDEFLYYGSEGPLSYDWRLIPEMNENGEVLTVLSAMHDTSTRKELEEERVKSSKLESLGLLAGGIAHDFNNILTALMGNISIARMMARREDRLDTVLAKAEAASLRARDLTQQLLTFSRGGTPAKQLASIAALLRDAAEFALRGAKAKAVFDIPDDLWSCEVDAAQVSQVFHNIVVNANQAMPSGGMIRVAARNVPDSVEEIAAHGIAPQVEIEISDQGIGIPREYLDRIFDPYFSTKPEGSGLGLATAYSIVKRHGGHIATESQVGAGATFRIVLPASLEKAAAADIADVASSKLKGRVLIMDDEEPVLDVAQRVLSGAGLDPAVAHDGKEALMLYKAALEGQNPFDVVIMDLTVPGGMGGLEMLARLKALDPSVRAIVSSGYANNDVLARYRDYGFVSRLVKPYRAEDLLEVLSALATPSASLSNKSEDGANGPA